MCRRMQPSVPPSGSRTLCELQCQFVNAPAGARGALAGPACPDADLASAAARGAQHQAAAGYAAVVKCPSGQWPPCYSPEDGAWKQGAHPGTAEQGGLCAVLQQLVQRLPAPAATRMLGLHSCPSRGKPLAWHPRQPLLAAGDASDRVQIYDYSRHMPLLGQGGQSAAPPPLQPLLLLQHDLQLQASAAAWRPHGGKSLAVGVSGGVCLWHLGRPPAGSGPRADASAWMLWLKAPGPGAVTALAWHPQGHLLAAASSQSPGFFVWDVATGTATPISAGPDPVTLLRWSPCGTYLLSAYPDSGFSIWETQTWWSQRWSAADGGAGGEAGGHVVDASWAPDCRTLLLAYSQSPQLVSLHFTSGPPSLQAQLLPLPLAELNSKAGSSRSTAAGTAGTAASSSSASSALVQAMAWDHKAQRLAVAVGGSHPAAGCVALYDTRCDPILSTRFIGFMRLGPLAPPAAAAAGTATGSAAADGWEEIQPEEAAEAQAAAAGGAPGPSRQPAGAAASAGRQGMVEGSGAVRQQEQDQGQGVPQLAFMPCFAQGALLAAKQGEHVAAVPLYFAA